jgi:hypothetical protein
MVMEKFYFNGDKYRIEDLVVESYKDKFHYFSCKLSAPNSATKAALGDGGHLLDDHKVVIKDRDGSTCFEGFLESVIPDGFDLKLEGRGYRVLLMDERCGRNLWINQSGSTIINALLAYSTKVVAGTIDFSGTISGTMAFHHTKILNAISSVCSQGDKDFWLTNEAGIIKLNVGTLESGTELLPVATYKAGHEIEIAKETTPIMDMVNRVRVFGAGDGINQIQACVPWIDINIVDSARSAGFDGYNADCLHADAITSQGTYGIMEGEPHIDTGLVSIETAIVAAKTILTASCSSDNLNNLEVDFLKYMPGRDVGDWVRIVDRKQGVDRTKKIIGIKRDFEDDKLVLEFMTAESEAADMLANVKRNSDFDNVNGLGATNLIEMNFPDICDNSHPYEFIFQLPDEVKFLNRIRLSYIIGAYRALSGVTSGGGSHSHTFKSKTYDPDLGALTGNVYVTGTRWDSVDNSVRVVGEQGVTRTIYGETSEAVSTHTHPITYEITEQAADLTDIQIAIDDGSGYTDPAVTTAAIEAEIGHALSTTQELNIPLDYFTANGGIKKIKIIPAGNNDGECRITGLLAVMFYMESA